MPEALPVSILGGYLGAGKTTLVNHVLRNANGRRIAVLVNEFGALPIDADLIEAEDDRLISISGGCVCCSYGNDLMQALLEMQDLSPRPDHILIESSGVALPGAIAATVSITDGLQIDGIIVLGDAETIRAQADNAYVGDTILRQLADADLVLLNKSDLVSGAELKKVQNWLLTAAPDAAVVTAQYARVSVEVILQGFEVAPHGTGVGDTPHTPAFRTQILKIGHVNDVDALARRLAHRDLGLIRAKGFVKTQGGMRAIQVVGRRWSVSKAPGNAQPGIVAIALSGDTHLDGLVDEFSGDPLR